MKCLRIDSTADGESHFDQVEIPTSSRAVMIFRSALYPAAMVEASESWRLLRSDSPNTSLLPRA
jgi:hypothetical protein